MTELLDKFYICDLGYDRQQFLPIEVGTLDNALARVQGSEPHWTDIRCVSRDLASARGLLDRTSSRIWSYSPRALHMSGEQRVSSPSVLHRSKTD